jgi:uncharacterized protein (TIRG00374 family)
VLIFFGLFYKIGFDRIAESLGRLNLWALPLAGGLFVLFLCLSALGSWVLLRAFSRLSFWKFLPCYLPSWALGLFLPGKLGEVSIVYYLKKRDIAVGQGTAFFVVGKTLTVLALGIIASTGFFTFFSFRMAVQLLLLLVVVLGGFISFLLSSFGKAIAKKTLPAKIQQKFAGFSSAFSSYFQTHKGLLSLSLGIRLLGYSCVAGISYFIFAVGLNVHLSIFKILQISSMETFSTLIPISVNGLGIRQALGIYLYGLLGVNAPIVASSQIVGWVIIYLFGASAFILLRPS